MTASEKYKTTTATTGDTPNQLIFIFDEITKLLHVAQKALKNEEHEIKFKSLSKVVEVLNALKSTIDIENADENTKALDGFYSSTISQLDEVNLVGTKSEELQNVINAITQLRIALVDANKNDNK